MTPNFARRIDLLEEPSKTQTSKLLAIERGDVSIDPTSRIRSEQFGLFPVHVPSPEVLSLLPVTYNADIIAVHGFGGDVHRTWQHENGFNWIHEIHEEFPGARVYAYGYDSGLLFSWGTSSLTNYARHLLSLIKLTRSNADEENRKIIFVCHGLGGLLVKQAILLSHNEEGVFGTIQKALGGIHFFATPHSGTSSETYEDVLLQLGFSILVSTLPDELLEHCRVLFFIKIQDSAPVLRDLSTDFGIHAGAIPIASYVETLPLPGMKKTLVSLQSATVRTLREHVVPIPGHDHRQLCKHSSLSSDSIRLIINELRYMIGEPTPNSLTQVDHASLPSPHTASTSELLNNQNLLRAVAAGNTEVARRLLESGVDCNGHDKGHNTALHIACEKDLAAIGLHLLLRGASVTKVNQQGNSPIHLAARSSVILAYAIMKSGGDLKAQNNDGWTPLHHAARSGKADLITRMLEQGANPDIRNKSNELPVRVARKALHLDAMKAFHKAGADSQVAMLQTIREVRADGDLLTRNSRNAISMAQNFPSVVSINFDMDVKIKANASPIAKSAQRGNLGAVEDMLDAGIVPGPDALYLAADECRSDVVEVLADVMEDIDTSVGWVGNALCAAACHTDGTNTLRVLLEKGANVNWQGGKYGCALQAATVNYRLENVKLLLRYGADVHARCGHYGNALTAAARHRTYFKEMATMFLELGVDIDAQGPGKYGNALQTAVHRFHVPNVKFLLEHGANAKVQGQFGSAVDIAQHNLAGEGYISNRAEKEEILFLLTEDEFDGLALED